MSSRCQSGDLLVRMMVMVLQKIYSVVSSCATFMLEEMTFAGGHHGVLSTLGAKQHFFAVNYFGQSLRSNGKRVVAANFTRDVNDCFNKISVYSLVVLVEVSCQMA